MGKGSGLMKKIRKMTGKKGIQKNISVGLTDHIDKLAKMIAKGNRNEEETRRWVIDVLVDAFGYDPDQIATELKALGKRVDIAVISQGKVLMVIECKASNIALKQSAANQAANYATNLGAEWAVVTNGQNWQLFHIGPKPGEEANIVQIFDIELFDEDGISKTDVELLYLITEESLNSGETLRTYHKRNCSDDTRIINTILSEPVIHFICTELQRTYQSEFGVAIDIEDINPELIRDIIMIYFGMEIENA